MRQNKLMLSALMVARAGYTLYDLGVVSGYATSHGSDIRNRIDGEWVAVGWCTKTTLEEVPFKKAKNSSMSALSTTSDFSRATGINQISQICGYEIVSGERVVKVWAGATTYTVSDTGFDLVAYDINFNSGSLGSSHPCVGYNWEIGTTDSTRDSAVFDYVSGTYTDVAIDGTHADEAHGVNTYGNYTGFISSISVFGDQAYAKIGGTIYLVSDDYDSHGEDINVYNWVTGNFDGEAMLWNPTGSLGNPTKLGVLSGESTSWGFGLNSSRTVVGASGGYAFVKPYGQSMENLNDYRTAGQISAGWVLEKATRINDDGDIVGYMLTNDGHRAFVAEKT